MIIVVEGTDGTGKTTLANELSGRLNMPVFKVLGSPLKGQAVSSSQAEDKAALAMAIATQTDVIFDRLHPSEHAYGRAYNRTALQEEVVWDLDEALAEVDHLCVFLRVFGDSWLNLVDQRSMTHDVPLEMLKIIQKEYDGFVHKSGCEWVVLNAEKPVGEMVELVNRRVVEIRPSKDLVWMRVAHEVSKRSTCLARRVGAVLVSDEHQIIATGYNGAPAGSPHQKTCPRLQEHLESGTALELCEDVHAEENCIAQAALNGHATRGGTLYSIYSPCHRCWRMCINAGLREVVYEKPYGDVRALEGDSKLKLRRM